MQQTKARPDKFLCTHTNEEILNLQTVNINEEYRMISDARSIQSNNDIIDQYHERWQVHEEHIHLHHPVNWSTFSSNRRHAILTNDTARRIQTFFNPGAYTALHHSNQSPKKQN